MRTNPSKHAGQRQIPHDNFQGFFVFAHLDHVDIALNVQSAGTCQTAGGFIAFINGKSTGDSLGILFISSFFSGEIFLIFIRKINGADLGTFTATGAFGKVNVAGLFADPGLEASRFTVQCEQFAFG
jgi:hypothetical protein